MNVNGRKGTGSCDDIRAYMHISLYTDAHTRPKHTQTTQLNDTQILSARTAFMSATLKLRPSLRMCWHTVL